MSRGFLFGMLAIFLSSCTPYQPASRIGERPPKNAIFATQLAGPGTYLAPMPTAVILLKPDDMARNRAFCAAFTQLPTAQEATARSVIAPNLILTRWLTQLSEMPPERVRDCEYLVGTYDYHRAAVLMASLHGVAGPTTGPGPFLVMIVPTSAGLRMAGIDGSGYASADFPKFVASWTEVINRTEAQLSAGPDRQPGLIRSIFDLVSATLRLVFGGAAGLIQGTLSGL